MAILVHDCPHCRTSQVALQIVAESPSRIPWARNIYLACPKCRAPAVAVLFNDAVRDTRKELPHIVEGNRSYHGDPTDDGWTLLSIWPSPEGPRIPAGLPEPVARALIQAENNYHLESHEEVSASMYRRALDLALKMIAPTDGGTLYERIKALADARKITSDIADWAHDVRLAGNDALHDSGQVTRPELAALRGLSDMVLTYLFTMPKMLADRRAAAAESLKA